MALRRLLGKRPLMKRLMGQEDEDEQRKQALIDECSMIIDDIQMYSEEIRTELPSYDTYELEELKPKLEMERQHIETIAPY